MARSTNLKKFLSEEEKEYVQKAVNQAEQQTSSEIKFVIVRHCWDDIRAKAAKIFKKLNLHKTKERNCVLILLVTTNHEFLIYGDEGIHEKVGQDFWDDVRNKMQNQFQENNFVEGVSEGIQLIGEKLAAYFPRQLTDVNEISDEVAYEE